MAPERPGLPCRIRYARAAQAGTVEFELTSIELIRHEFPGVELGLIVTQSRGVADEPPMLDPSLRSALDDLLDMLLLELPQLLCHCKILS